MVFNNFINLKGGVLLNKEWQTNPEGALFYFINNCRKSKIIFDTSISCVCYKFYDLPPGIVSPYVSIRSTNLEQPVTSILFKIGFISKIPNDTEYIPCMRSKGKDTYKGEIEAVPNVTVTNEIKAQHDIYLRSSALDQLSPFEPLCPAIICYSLDINVDSKKFIFDMILSKLEQRRGGVGRGAKYVISDKQVTKNLYELERNISIIVMEFMDGYENMSEFEHDKRIEYFKVMHNFELYRLGYYGYLHMDSHWGNVMINPNYPYFTNDASNFWIGKALIIDFGRIKDIRGRNIGNQIVMQYSNRNQINTPHYNKKLRDLRAAMALSFLASLDEPKKIRLLELISNNQIMLNLKGLPILKSKKMIEDEHVEDERREAERLEDERREAERLEDERREAQRVEESAKMEFYSVKEPESSEQKFYSVKEPESSEQKFYSVKEPESSEHKIYSVKEPESSEHKIYSVKDDHENLGEAAYIKVAGNVPSASPIFGCFGFWNWGRILLVNTRKKGMFVKMRNALNRGGNGDQSCPNLSININNIPKCFKNQKEFRDMTLLLHPDKNINCSEEDKKRAIEKFKILNSNKDEQNTNYGGINETTYEMCESSDDSKINIQEESEEIELFNNNQEKMDSLYLKSMKGKEISKDVYEKINFIFKLSNEKGENNINEINNIFETILQELYEILDSRNKSYNSTSQSILDDNTNVSKTRLKIENLKKNLTQKIKEYREQIALLLRDNSIHTSPEDESLLITCIVDVTFRNYVINIEKLNNAINSIDGLINIKNGNKINLLNIWFGIPENFRITQNGGNELTTINSKTQISRFYDKVPVYGLKYELATTPTISLIKKYKIGTLNIANLNINSEQFNNNIKDMVKEPFVFKNIPITGGKLNKPNLKKYNKTIKNKTKKIRKNKKTKRRH